MSYAKGVIINNIVSDSKKQGYDKIYADIIGFETPFVIGLKNTDKGFQPDVIIVRNDNIDLFSIETNIEKKVSKTDFERWRLFRIFAKANNGNLFLAGNAHNLKIIKNSIELIPSNLKFINLI
jgi:hypothetical protein